MYYKYNCKCWIRSVILDIEKCYWWECYWYNFWFGLFRSFENIRFNWCLSNFLFRVKTILSLLRNFFLIFLFDWFHVHEIFFFPCKQLGAESAPSWDEVLHAKYLINGIFVVKQKKIVKFFYFNNTRF